MVPRKKLQIKSYNSIVSLELEGYSYGDAIEKIDEKFSASNMYDGFVINKIVSSRLTDKEIEDIKTYLLRQYNIVYREKDLSIEKKKEAINELFGGKPINVVDLKPEEVLERLPVNGLGKRDEKEDKRVELKIEEKTKGKVKKNGKKKSEELPTKIIKQTLRSGTQIDFEGNILVIGDVNPGAKLIAKGDIIVIGNLRGFAHAGTGGNKRAMILSHSINATQLAIDDIIAIPPKDFSEKKGEYYVATVDKLDNQIVIEAKK